jgi:N-methylhydantoinase A/oxoprolinase/acetone carboxylase beta subunit
MLQFWIRAVKRGRYILSNGKEPVGTKLGKLGLGIDVGGTYTDAVLYDLSWNRLLSKEKALTTKWNFVEGIGEALAGLDPSLLASVNLVALSSTLATNAIVEGKGQKVGLLFMPPYGLFEPEDITHEPKACISGRLEITGVPIEPVDESEVTRIARQMVHQHQVKAFAVSGFAGVINPEHELLVKRMVQNETGLFVTCGHELSDLLDFRTRAYTAIMNGRIVPLLARLLSDVETVLDRFEIRAPIAVVRGDGSLMRKEAALERPVETILSGPAASVAGAQHLTGRRDAIVVDMGGTTTDAALVRDGRVDTNDEGSNVGGHKTHVQALRIRTLGLGGDSFITCERGQFEIGPQRVISMAWLGTHRCGVDQALDYIQKHQNRYWDSTTQLQILTQQGRHDAGSLTAQENDILSLLGQRPFALHELAAELGFSYWNPGIIANLEEKHLVQRCGFTPTDVLNCRGDLTLWSTTTSQRMCEILSAITGKSPAEIIEDLMQAIVVKLALAIFKRQLDEETDPEALENCEVCRVITGSMFGNGSAEYTIRLGMQKPIIGIGTPTYLFLPAAASLLGAEPVLPDHADVANAIGAITSKVVVRKRVQIRARQGGGFRIEGLPDATYFRNFDEAMSLAENELTRIVRDTALASGTDESAITIHAQDYIHTRANGNRTVLGCSLLAELKGEPSY